MLQHLSFKPVIEVPILLRPGNRGCKTIARIQTGQDLGAPLYDATYQQSGFPVWQAFQRSTCLSADMMPKFQYCTYRWFVHLERGRKNSEKQSSWRWYSGTSSVSTSSLRCSPLQASDDMNVTTLDSIVRTQCLPEAFITAAP